MRERSGDRRNRASAAISKNENAETTCCGRFEFFPRSHRAESKILESADWAISVVALSWTTSPSGDDGVSPGAAHLVTLVRPSSARAHDAPPRADAASHLRRARARPGLLWRRARRLPLRSRVDPRSRLRADAPDGRRRRSRSRRLATVVVASPPPPPPLPLPVRRGARAPAWRADTVRTPRRRRETRVGVLHVFGRVRGFARLREPRPRPGFGAGAGEKLERMEILEESAAYDPEIKDLLDGANSGQTRWSGGSASGSRRGRRRCTRSARSTVPMLVRFGGSARTTSGSTSSATTRSRSRSSRCWRRYSSPGSSSRSSGVSTARTSRCSRSSTR